MLEGPVANLLNRFLGMYVQNFDAKQLNVGIWSGDVKLRDLELRREALDQLHLPLNVVQGHLGLLTLSIPWSNLRGKPVRVSIEDVFLLAAPRVDAHYDADEQNRRAHAVKMEKLDSAEMLKERTTEGMSQEEQQKNQSFTASLVTAIVDNVQISVKSVHVRYEDSLSDPGHPFALGITLSELSAVSTDENWKPTFIQSASASTHKLATLGSFSVYWDTDAELLCSGTGATQALDHAEFVKELRAMIGRSDSSTIAEHQFILKPVSGRAGLEMDKTGKADRPKIKARLLFEELGFIIDEDQYRDALMLVDLFHYFIRHQEYKRLQPKSRPKEDPRAWLQFAGNAVLEKIHDRNRRWSWAYFKERRDDRIRYIELFKKKKREEHLTQDELRDMDTLEHKLSYEDLRFWRSLARNQLRKDNVGVKKPSKQKSWSSWLWRGNHEEASDDSQMSDQQRKELYEAIDWDEKKQLTEAIDMPRDYVKMQVEMSLRTGSFTLRRDPHGSATEILRLLFDSFSTKVLQRTDSMLAELSLDGMRLYDGTTEGSLFPQMVTVKDAPPVPDGTRIEELNDDETSKDKADDTVADPFFQLSFENNPLDGSADMALNVRLKSMEIVYNPRFVVEVVKFFKPPESRMESIGALMETAGATVEGLRQQTRAGLEFALEEHRTINAQLDLQAPLIIIPDSVTKESSICLILDAGHAKVSSELIDKETLRDIQSKHGSQFSEDDLKRLQGLMYDKFTLVLDSTQVLIGTSIDETKAELAASHGSKRLHIVDRINIDFTIETCIVPKASDMTRFRISGNLPVLHASISDAKYKNLMKLIDVAVPKFEDTQTPETQGAHRKLQPADPKPVEDPASNPLARARSKSFQLAARHRELVVSDAGSEASDAKADNATDATKSDVPIHQRKFEFKFTVDRLQGSLYRSDPAGKKLDQLLVELVAEHFHLEFYQRWFDMAAEVRLKSLAIVDHVDPDPLPEFRNLISSDAAGERDLFQLKFVKVNSDSPEFTSKYEGIATNLDVHVSTINLIVTRATLLTLLDFVLITFTNPGQAERGDQRVESSPEDGNNTTIATATPDPDKIRIGAELKGISVILNNDGIRLATLSLSTADVGVFIMGKTMRVGGRLGSLSLIDDVNQGVPEGSSLRQLVTIEGTELLDFAYETFDSDAATYPGYDTSIYLRSGSIKVNFVTEPFRKMMEFAVKFGKMQAIFNAARQAAVEQASQVQERANKMHFDILIHTPIVVFPRWVAAEGQVERDSLTAHLGEIYANNTFVSLDDSGNADTANRLSAGLRNIRLTSLFHYEDGKLEELDLIDKVDLGFDITYVEHKPDSKRPDLEVVGTMSNINLRLTQAQMKFMLELSRSIPAAFATEPEAAMTEEVEQEVPDATLKRASMSRDSEPESAVSARPGPTSLEPGLGSQEAAWTKIDLVFKIGAIALELINANETKPVGDVDAASLSKFSLNETSVKMRMLSDSSLESELLIQSFTITDTRTREKNKFRKVMSLINNDVKQQFMSSVSISGGSDRHMIVLLTIDSPRVILALDYLFAIQAFVNAGLSVEEPIEIDTEEDDTATEEMEYSSSDLSSSTARLDAQAPAPKEREQKSTMEMSFRINVVDTQAVLIANPAMSNSEAIVLGTKQMLISKQHATTLQVDRVGMFLCRMDQWETTRLRILDDFSIQTSLDMRSQATGSSLTSIQVDIDPLVLRVSLRDIMLAMQIMNRASAMNASDDTKLQGHEPERMTEARGSTTSAHAKSTIGRSTKDKQTAKTASTRRSMAGRNVAKEYESAMIKKEEMKATLHGLRVVIIGDRHELPMLDWSVKKFDIDVRDWSGAMVADASIDTFFNIFNFSKSAWEPLVEPWQVGFHMSKERSPERLAVDVYSRKSLDLTITAATIALASKSADFLSSEEDVLSKPRGSDAPYRIRNYTGFDTSVWAVSDDTDLGSAMKLADGHEAPWRFEDPTITRETLAPEGATGIVGIRLEGSGFDSVDRIPVNREGEHIYPLQPRKDRVLHRICVEVLLGQDNVKYITLRSPLVVENNTQIPVEIGVFSPEDGTLLKIESIAPGNARPAPVGGAFMHSLIVRPDAGFGYTWSNERLFWRDLLKRPTRIITCRGESDNASPPFYFQLHAAYDRKDPLAQAYPCMRIKIHAPVEVVNLLPYDFKYRIYDDNTKKDWTNFLRKGGVSPVHVVELSHLLLLSVEMQDTPFKSSKFSVINPSDKENFRREKSLEVRDNRDLVLRLKLHYYNIPDSGGAFKVAVHSPYVVLNRTGLDLDVRSKTFFGQAKAAAGADVFANTQRDSTRAQPFMFSFPTDDHKNRALIKVGDANWSRPQSFDAIGSTYSIALQNDQARCQMHVGVTIEEGEGKYNLTKVVTIAPRYIIKNRMNEDINFREPGSPNILTLKGGSLLPLRYLRLGERQQLCLCFPGVSNQWSAPFDIANVGSVHVKLAKSGQRQQLIRVEILLEAATIFLHVSVETRHWPFSMRNESDTEFMFWQTNPNVDEDEEDRGVGWRPIRYRLPPKSIMPYAWDYPAAKNKEIMLETSKRERHVKLAEIGNLVPLKLPPTTGSPHARIIDLSVVAHGPTQTLVVSNWRPSKSLYKQKSVAASRSATDGFEIKDVDTNVMFKATLRVAGIGISLINRQLRELVYVTLRDIELNYGDSALCQQFSTTIKWVQIDNQLYGGIFPILFYPSVVPKTGKEMEAHPILQASITRVKDDSYGVLYIKYFSFLLQQMTLEIDEDFIFALLDFAKIPGASWSEVKEGKLCDEELDMPEPKQDQGEQDVYFELLHLQPMQFDLSFVRTERINAEDTMASSNPFMFAVNVLTMSIGNVNDAPLRYNALILENARVSVAALVNSIRSHYVQESLRQVHLILGSADFLGNPVGLFQNVSSGVTDIFYEPYKGLVMTDRPQDLGIGIAKGASSFVKKSVFGFSDSMAKFTGSLSKGLAVATMDQEFQKSRRMKRSRNRPKHALYGITSGGNAFAESLASGIGGLARHPLQGVEKEGALGLVKGIGKGLLGVPTKAAIGAFDLASNMAEGVRNTTTVFDQEGLDRVRLSRFIGQDGIVRPYSQREALGQFWLKTLENGRYFNEDYIAHLELPGNDLLVMLTYNGIMLVRTRKLTAEWDVPLKNIQTISKERTGMSITLKGGNNGPFIPVGDEQGRNWLYRQVAIAVNAYNGKWNARG